MEIHESQTRFFKKAQTYAMGTSSIVIKTPIHDFTPKISLFIIFLRLNANTPGLMVVVEIKHIKITGGGGGGAIKESWELWPFQRNVSRHAGEIQIIYD